MAPLAAAAAASLTALLLVPGGARGHVPVLPAREPRNFFGPHGQPGTAAQDDSSCGVLLLPAHFQLVGHPEGWFQRSGEWQNMDQAALATWQQELLRWSPNKLYFSRSSKMLFKATPAEDDDEERPLAATILRDCEGVPMYTFSERPGERYGFDIFDRLGTFMARSQFGRSDFFPEQILFSDPVGNPIAIAESPMVIRPSVAGFSSLPKGMNPDIAVAPWEVWFYSSEHTNSSLIQAQHRWAIAAIVQSLALSDAHGPGAPAPSEVRVFAITLFSLVVLFIVGSSLAACVHAHDLALPPIRKGEENPFLKNYGAVQPRFPRPPGSQQRP